MDTNKQVIPILLAGTQTGIDPKVISNAITVKHGRWTREGAIAKRPGSNACMWDYESASRGAGPIYYKSANTMAHCGLGKLGNVIAWGTQYAQRYGRNLFYEPNSGSPTINPKDTEALPLLLGTTGLHHYASNLSKLGNVYVAYTTYDGTNYAIHCEHFIEMGPFLWTALNTGAPYPYGFGVGQHLTRHSAQDIATGLTAPDAAKMFMWRDSTLIAAIGSGAIYPYCLYFNTSHQLCAYKYTGTAWSTSVLDSTNVRHATTKSFDIVHLPNVAGTPRLAVVYRQSDAVHGSNAISVVILGNTVGVGLQEISQFHFHPSAAPFSIGCNYLSDTELAISYVCNDGTNDEVHGVAYNLAGSAVISDVAIEAHVAATYSVTNTAPLRDSDADSFLVYSTRKTDATGVCSVRVGRVIDSGAGVGALSGTPTNVCSRGELHTKPYWISATDRRLGIYTEGYYSSTDHSQGQLLLCEVTDADTLTVIGRSLPGWIRTDPNHNLSMLHDYAPVYDLATYGTYGYETFAELEVTSAPSSLTNTQQYCGYIVRQYTTQPYCLSHNTATHTMLPGTLPLIFDGQTMVPHGFPLYPASISLSSAGSGSGLDAGTYGYKAIYEYVDGSGDIQRSPATPIAATITLGAGPSTVTVTLPTLPLDTHRGTHTRIVVYRTSASGTVYYRLGDTANSEASQTVTYTDSLPDASLLASATLYTHADTDDDMCPSYRIATLWQDRMYVVDRELECTDIWYSKPIVDGHAPTFDGLQIIKIPSEGGPITGLAQYGGSLIVFKTHQTYAINVSDLALQRSLSTYSPPVLIDPAVGCADQRSIARVPMGLVFADQYTGFHLFSGSAVSSIGLEVKYYTDTYQYFRALAVPRDEHIVFISSSSDAPALVYNWRFQKWSTWPGYYGIDAVEADGEIYRLASDGRQMLIDLESTYTDTTAATDTTTTASNYSLTVETGWITLGGMGASRMRVRKIILVGDNIADHTLRVKLGFDGDPYWSETYSFDGTAMQHFSYADMYGAGLASTYANNAYVLTLQPARQKCSAIRIHISDESSSSSGYAITAIALEVSPKSGAIKQGSSRRIS